MRLFCAIFVKVSALIHGGIVFNHGFVDGNKRTSLYLAILLIEKSGYSNRVNPVAMIEFIPAVARGEFTREELAEWLRMKSLWRLINKDHCLQHLRCRSPNRLKAQFDLLDNESVGYMGS